MKHHPAHRNRMISESDRELDNLFNNWFACSTFDKELLGDKLNWICDNTIGNWYRQDLRYRLIYFEKKEDWVAYLLTWNK